MLKKTFLLLVVLVCTIAAQAQTVDEIITKSLENTGGVEKWKALKSTKMEGTMAMQGFEFPGTVYAKAPKKQRVEVNVQGKNIVQAYDGTTPWWINPFAGSEDPQKMPDEMSEQMVNDEFESEFIDYKTKGHQVALEGKQTVEGTETFKVKLTKKNGDVEYYYFDTENYVPIMIQTVVKTGPAKGQLTETYLSDYQEVDGLVFPFFMETKMAGQSIQKMTIKSIKTNETYEDTLFAFPKK
ncbi:MAG: outer membrane lipoprotein-sorting protein [Saprospiraceae bacterium]